MVVYNPDTHTVSHLQAAYLFQLPGEIAHTSSVSTTNVQPYASRGDAARAVLEVIFVLAFLRTVWVDVDDVLIARDAGRMGEYLLSLPQVVDTFGFLLTGASAAQKPRHAILHLCARVCLY